MEAYWKNKLDYCPKCDCYCACHPCHHTEYVHTFDEPIIEGKDENPPEPEDENYNPEFGH